MDDSPAPSPSRADLFLTYGKIGLIGFGGINAWARRVLVEEKRWLTEQEYAETLGLGQVLPGPNALNAAIMIGDRFHGAVGALLASCSMFGGPLIILMGLAVLYDSYGEVPLVKAVLAGVAAAAAGMVDGKGPGKEGVRVTRSSSGGKDGLCQPAAPTRTAKGGAAECL
jgi:chromate transporter